MKPHEENWQFDGYTGYAPRISTPGAAMEPERDYDGCAEWNKEDPDRFRLAACAPEMARMLLELEWAGYEWDYGGCESRCCFCDGQPPMTCVDGSVLYGTHSETCPYDALLKKAGVR